MEAGTIKKHFFTNVYPREEQKSEQRLQIYYAHAEDGLQTCLWPKVYLKKSENVANMVTSYKI